MDPKKNWLQMRYCITGEEFQWFMKYRRDEWKVIVTIKKGQKGKKPVEVAMPHKSNSPIANTREVVEHAKDIGGSVIVIKPRQKTTKHPSAEGKDHFEVRNEGT